MATPFAVRSDVEAFIFRSLSTDEQSPVDRLLRTASNIIRQAVANIDGRIAAFTTPAAGVTPIDPDVVTDVTAQMVARVVRNPDGAKTEAAGPASISYDDRVAAGFLYLTPEDLAQLLPRPRPSVGTVTVGEGLARHLERRADPELRRGLYGRTWWGEGEGG